MAVGETVHLAARLQTLAAPNTIVVSDATHAQTSPLFEMEDLGPVDLKGFSTVQRVWRVHRETALSGRSEALFASAQAPIVGRDEELEFLLRQWRQTIAGDGRVVLLSGEAGIGKSRLLAALEERLAGERHYSLRYFCSPYHQDDALYPIISRWEREIGFARADTPEDRLRKLEAIVASRGLAPKDTPLLAAMLSVPLGDRYPRPRSQRAASEGEDLRHADRARWKAWQRCDRYWSCSKMRIGPIRPRSNWSRRGSTAWPACPCSGSSRSVPNSSRPGPAGRT